MNHNGSHGYEHGHVTKLSYIYRLKLSLGRACRCNIGGLDVRGEQCGRLQGEFCRRESRTLMNYDKGPCLELHCVFEWIASVPCPRGRFECRPPRTCAIKCGISPALVRCCASGFWLRDARGPPHSPQLPCNSLVRVRRVRSHARCCTIGPSLRPKMRNRGIPRIFPQIS
jgi:hypothetical protein